MSKTVTGTIERQGFGPGTWALASDDGQTYELKNAPAELRQAGVKATVTGEIRDDVMSLAMIGPVLEVRSFELN
ncbi:MAG: hypothetical protein KME17_26350 [Cyanosarcina radialis HA8281-LM2]|jgi:sarcosine oxidase gamma subunit|nr:hypothetical protein [Cyanosarcina radialis HA8281-LM2]